MWNVIASSLASVPMERIAQASITLCPDCYSSMVLFIIALQYLVHVVLVCDHLSSDLLIVLSLGLKPRMDRCSRSLLRCSIIRKRCHYSFVSCVLWCACLHWWVCNHCKACVRHIRFSDHCPGLSLIPNSPLLQGACADRWLAHILLNRISEQTWFIGPLTWYGEWTFGTEFCRCRLFWLLKYFSTVWFLDLFILRTWCSLDNFDLTTSWKWHPQLPCRNSLCRPIVIVNVSTTS